jgi:subtilisin family serine protease
VTNDFPDILPLCLSSHPKWPGRFADRAAAPLHRIGISVWALFLGCCLQISGKAAEAGTSAPLNRAAQREDRFLVKPKDGVSPQDLTRFHAESHCELLRHFPGFGGVQVLRVPPGESVRDMVQRYRKGGLVEYAEPDYKINLASVFPNDPSFLDGTQWGLNNAGQNGGVANADIDAPEGWSAMTSASNVIVAVVDSGVRYTHQDLTGNMWTNSLDGSYGTNVVAGTNDPNDDNGHGTRLAGIIGGMGNNGTGVAGVAWQVQIMACKFVDHSGNGSVSDAIAGLEYAQTNGAQIINASWGLDDFSLSLSNAIAALREAGILVVAAAGNDAVDTDVAPHYPASYNLDNIVAVMATTRRDEVYALSNIGATNVDLAAPGEEIYSSDNQSDSSYASDDGTSMATAYVTGAAALLRTAHPSETPAQIIGRLLAAVDPLPSLSGACVSGGRLNLRKAMGVAVSAPLLSAGSTPNGDFLLQLSGNPGRAYVIEASTNLWQWSDTSTNLTGLGGSFVITNTLAGSLPAQFFRARLVP